MDALNDAALKTAVSLGEQRTRIQTLEVPHSDKQLALVAPAGMVMQSISANANPDRIRACREFSDVVSFTTYVKRFQNPTLLVNGCIDKRSFAAELDYHTPDTPSWNTHKALLHLRHTEEFKSWQTNNDTFMDQLIFAQFIEDHITDIVSPSGADMLEMCKTLEAKTGVGFTGKVSLNQGVVSLNYQDDSTVTSGVVQIPDIFTLKLAPFYGMPEIAVKCRFRWSIQKPSLKLGYKILSLERIIQDSIKTAGELITESLETPVLY